MRSVGAGRTSIGSATLFVLSGSRLDCFGIISIGQQPKNLRDKAGRDHGSGQSSSLDDATNIKSSHLDAVERRSDPPSSIDVFVGYQCHFDGHIRLLLTGSKLAQLFRAEAWFEETSRKKR